MSKLISYTTLDFQTDAHLKLYLKYFEERDKDTKVTKSLKEAGLLRRTVSQVWNAKDVHRLGLYFEYKDEKSYQNVQVLIKKFLDNPETKVFLENAKMSSSRSIIIYDKVF